MKFNTKKYVKKIMNERNKSINDMKLFNIHYDDDGHWFIHVRIVPFNLIGYTFEIEHGELLRSQDVTFKNKKLMWALAKLPVELRDLYIGAPEGEEIRLLETIYIDDEKKTILHIFKQNGMRDILIA